MKLYYIQDKNVLDIQYFCVADNKYHDPIMTLMESRHGKQLNGKILFDYGPIFGDAPNRFIVVTMKNGEVVPDKTHSVQIRYQWLNALRKSKIDE